MSRYIPYSINFCHGERCHFCNRPLPTGVAHQLLDQETSTVIFSGPTCFKKNTEASDKKLPNFATAGIFKAPKETKPQKKADAVKSQAATVTVRESQSDEIQYLILRVDLLKSFEVEPPAAFVDYFDQYRKTFTLDESSFNHIKNTINKVSTDYPLLSLKNLMNC